MSICRETQYTFRDADGFIIAVLATNTDEAIKKAEQQGKELGKKKLSLIGVAELPLPPIQLQRTGCGSSLPWLLSD